MHPPAPRALDVDVEPLDQGARPLVGRATGQQDERVRALVGHDAGRRLGGRSTGRLASRGRPGAPRRTRSRRRRRRRPGRVGRSGSDVRRFEKRAQGLDQLGRRGVANRQEIQALVGPGPVDLVEHLAHRRDVAAVVGHHDDAGPWQIHDLAGGRGERGERLRQVATGHLRRPEDDAHQLLASRRPRGRAEQRQRLPLGCRRLHDLEEVTSRHHGQVQALQGDEEEAPGLARLHRPRRHHRHRELPRRHRPGEDEVLAGEAHRPPGQLLQLHPGPQAHRSSARAPSRTGRARRPRPGSPRMIRRTSRSASRPALPASSRPASRPPSRPPSRPARPSRSAGQSRGRGRHGRAGELPRRRPLRRRPASRAGTRSFAPWHVRLFKGGATSGVRGDTAPCAAAVIAVASRADRLSSMRSSRRDGSSREATHRRHDVAIRRLRAGRSRTRRRRCSWRHRGARGCAPAAGWRSAGRRRPST